MKTVCSGYLLIELALVLSIVGVLLAPLIRIGQTQQQSRQQALVLEQRRQVQQALEGFVMTHARLPCPATPNGPKAPNGASMHHETRINQACTHAAGKLPTATLGLAPARLGDWVFVVATLEQAGAPAAHALFQDALDPALSLQALTKIIYQPITPSNGLQDSALPAIHLCLHRAGETLPAPATRGCGTHDLHSAAIVAMAYPTDGANSLNRHRIHQFFLSPTDPTQQLVWLSLEQFVGLRVRAGW